MSSKTGSLLTRVYGGFRGVDFRGEDVSLQRSPDSLNLWKDYRETDSIRTRPAMALHTPFDRPVYGIFFYGGDPIVHSGTALYRITAEEKTVLFDGMNPAPSRGFVHENTLYLHDGANYLRYDGAAVSAVEGYVPTTSIGRAPAGGGTVHEDVNLLTGRRINTFLADGGSFDFYLDTPGLDTDFIPRVTVDGVTLTEGYTVDYAAGKISFTKAPPPPLTGGQDNVAVEFSKTVDGYRGCILNCTLLQVFDNRVFFSGNGEYPNVVWHSSLNDPTYISDLDYYREGLDSARIRGMAAGNNALWVFREPSDSGTNVFYHTPTLDGDYGKIYPSVHSSVAIGCVGGAVNFNDDIVFFSSRGMEGISGDITTEQAAAHRSSLVDRRLTAEPGYESMLLAEWEGYLLVFIGSHVYLADSRTPFSNDGHREYEWFYWELEQAVTAVRTHGGTLYLGTAEGLYTLSDRTAPLPCHWVTPKDRFGCLHKHKTSHRRGCVAEGAGDVTVYAKTEDSDFEQVGEYTAVTDCFVSRFKRKRFKDLQLKFRSDSRFSLETVTLEVWLGGYIKP